MTRDDPPGTGRRAERALRLDELDAVLFGVGAVVITGRPHEPAGPQALPGALTLMRRLKAAGLAIGVVSASRDAGQPLAAAGLSELVDVQVDEAAAVAMGLAGPPGAGLYQEAAARLGVDPGRAAVVETSRPAVRAGRRGGFRLVAGLAPPGGTATLLAAGADLAASELSALPVTGRGPLADGWHLTYRPAGDAGEGMREALCTLGNGYFATRGARAEASDDGQHYPGTYLAGVYDRLPSQAGGRSVEHESIVNAPNWLPLSFAAAGGPWLGEPGTAVTGEELRLGLRAGVLLRRFRVTDPAGRRTLVVQRRLVSMADPHLAAIRLDLVAENWSGTLRIRSGIDATCCTEQTAEERLLSHCHLRLESTGQDPPGTLWLAARTVQSGITIAQAARTDVAGAAGPGHFRAGDRRIGREWAIEVAAGARCRVEKVAAVYTSRDPAITEPVAAVRQAVAEAPSFGELLAAHRAAWARLWSRALAEVAAAGQPPGVVNLHLFHLLQVASPHVTGIDAGLGARGLHGEGYLGHVFWDELFVFRFLNIHFPEVSRALLDYRHRRLPAARRLARQAGETGARFPWQSGSDGREETPVTLFNPRSGHWVPDRSCAQRHVGLAVAYNCWRYWEATGDDAFLRGRGAEVLLEVARHFAHLACFDEALGRFRIRAVMGPDEFHDGYPWASEPGVDDNAYTNVLASWVLARAAALSHRLGNGGGGDIIGRLGIDEAETGLFAQVSRGLHVPFHDGVISQFADYERLEPIDLAAYRARYRNIGRLDLILEAEGDTVRRYQVAKQADTLMLCYLFEPAELKEIFAHLGYQLTGECIRDTIAYYSARSTHGSTLSQVVHAWVTARVNREASWRHFTEALAADMADTQGGTTSEGIHLGAMAGTIDLLQRCYPGLQTRDGTLILDPALPSEITALNLALSYRGHQLTAGITHDRITVSSARSEAAPVTLTLAGQQVLLRPGERTVRRLPSGTMRPQPPRRARRQQEQFATAADPVCGMVIQESTAAASADYRGARYCFCSRTCQGLFAAGPEAYVPVT